MSVKLWWSWNRTFPELPIHDALLNTPSQVSNSISFLSVVFMILALIKPKQILLVSILVLELFLMGLDQVRWQPSIFQFMVTLSLGLLSPRLFKSYFFFLLSVTYIFSGLQKLNLGFINFIWGKFFLIDFLNIAPEIAFHRAVKAIGFALPLTEISLGLILWTKFRNWAWSFIIVMHFLLLFALGPFGTNFNSIIWPWNVLMIVFAALFLEDRCSDYKLNHFRNVSFIILGIVIVILPVFSFFGKHSPLMSFSLYSGGTDFLYAYSPTTQPDFKTLTYKGKEYISVFDWSMKELNVPMVPYLPVFEEFKTRFRDEFSSESQFLIRSYPYKRDNTLPFDK
ncbi:hypothetical protein [Psychroflexus tropicus]|uniref:hypothetical protein n=1 Tax=Psychroflexus tropicus TaxID=197345 RepID=UPI0003784F53|nr:hypothetical protein [Psychroflexus tropicus]